MKDLSAQHVPCAAAATLRSLAEVAEARGYSFDTYGEGVSLANFESTCAALLGKPAAIFCPSGTAAQQAALLTLAVGAEPLAGRRPILLLHPTSHRCVLRHPNPYPLAYPPSPQTPRTRKAVG